MTIMKRLAPILSRLLLPTVTLCLLLVSHGCKSLEERQAEEYAEADVADILRIDAGVSNREAKSSRGASAETPITNLKPSYEAESAAGTLPTRNLSERPGSGIELPYNFALDMIKGLENPEEMIEVTVKFDNDEIPYVVKQMALTLGFEFYLDPAVSGTVTFSIDSQMTRAQVWELFAKILWFNDAYITRDHGFVRIMSMEKMPREQRLLAKDAPRTNIAVELVRFSETLASDMAPLIAPYLSPKATITPVPHLNALLIVDTPANVDKLQELVSRLDRMGETTWPQDSIGVHYISPTVIAEELKQVLPILGFRVSVGEKSDNLSIRLMPIDRLQALVVTAPHIDIIQEIRRWVQVLDRQDTGEEEQIYFYEAKHTKAEDLADAVNFFFNSSVGRSRRPTASGGDDAATSTAEPAATSRTGGAGRGTESTSIRESVFEIPASVFVDGKHNRMVIRTTPRAHATMLALLQSLDTPPFQVLIQMSIAEIQLNEDTRLGFKYSALSKIQGGEYEFLSRFAYGDDLSATASPGLNLVLNKVSDPTKVFGFIEAVAGKGNTRVLFSPQVLAISDEEAIINVGDKVPIITQENNATDSTNITREIQYQDTGIIMTVTPHVTASRMVTLKIKQEVSDAVTTTSSDIDSPTIQTRIVQTSLIVDDNSTILLGGLIRTRDIKNETGIPFLKDIPGVGNLFALNVRENQRLELLILMTVNVIEMDADVERLARRYKSALQAIKEQLGPANLERQVDAP